MSTSQQRWAIGAAAAAGVSLVLCVLLRRDKSTCGEDDVSFATSDAVAAKAHQRKLDALFARAADYAGKVRAGDDAPASATAAHELLTQTLLAIDSMPSKEQRTAALTRVNEASKELTGLGFPPP